MQAVALIALIFIILVLASQLIIKCAQRNAAMLIPNDAQCALIIQELWEHDQKTGELTDFERQFVESNLERKSFTDKQKERVIVNLVDKYDLQCMRGHK